MSFKCPHCGNTIHPTSITCIFCEQQVRTIEEQIKMHDKNNKLCWQCGYINENFGNYCKNCGYPLTEEGIAQYRKAQDEMPKDLSFLLKSLKKSSQLDILKKMKKLAKMTDKEKEDYFKDTE